jgi:hypothetical protein
MAGAVRVPQRDRDNNAKLTANLQCCQLRKAHNAPIGGGLYRRSRIRNETRARARASTATVLRSCGSFIYRTNKEGDIGRRAI